jgi:flagellar motor protein MotB
MKKFLVLVAIVAALFAVFAITACPSTPPPPPPAAPPPPPPPPPVEVEEEVDVSPPVLTVTLSPQPFSPDGDGVDDELTVTIGVQSATPISSWHIEIREPEPPYLLFSEWSGEGDPPKSLVWDGLSSDGELVQSASTYHFGLVVSNQYASETYQGTINVDVLVRREGEILRVIVPSIVFAPNAGDFKGLDQERMANNDRILRRIAEVLDKFGTYRVKVEGHANPTTAPGTRARTQEETGTRTVIGLQPLSQRRAQAVLDYLTNLGVDHDRLTAIGVGSAHTVVEFADKDNWWKNRRVEFILEKPQEPQEESE